MKITGIVILVVIALSLILTGCGDGASTTTTQASGEGAKAGDKVAVDYTGTLEDSTEFDSSRDREPLEFTVGAGQMIAGFDAAVVGMKVGETKTVTIPPEQAYGLHRDDRVLRFEREEFSGSLPSVGDKIPLQNAMGQVVYYAVVEVTPDYVAVDTNHELAGKTLIFEITMVSITPGSATP